MPNFAIFGGTFNPVHWGHLLLAETAFDQFRLDRVIWIPTVHPPHKAQQLVSFEHRLEMVRRAIADQPAFTVAIDHHQQDPSYAIDTLRALQTLEPDACWHWIIGNDAFQSLPQWKASRELMTQCIWLVAPRGAEDGEMGRWGDGEMGNSQEDANKSNEAKEHGAVEASPPHSLTPHSLLLTPHPSLLTPHPSWYPLQMPSIAISSSLIRHRCREGRSIRYLLPEAVRCYILEQDLYQMS